MSVKENFAYLTAFKNFLTKINKISTAFKFSKHKRRHNLQETSPTISILLRLHSTLPMSSARYG